MNKKIFQLVFFLIIIAVFGVIMKDYVDSIVSDIEDYRLVIEEIPQSEISRLAPITLHLAQDVDEEKFPLNVPLDIDIIKFKPAIEGYTYFTDKRTIEFQPNEPLPSGQIYMARLNLNKVFASSNFKPFRFTFATPELTFKLKIKETVYYDSTDNRTPYLKGFITFNDYIDYEKKQSLISATQNNKPLSFIFSPGKNNQSFEFRINDIERTSNTEPVKIYWSGKSFGSKIMDSTSVAIASNDSFKVAYCKLNHLPKPFINLRFTDPINPNIFVDSFITITNLNDYQIELTQNEIKIKFNTITQNHHVLIISKELLNRNGIKLTNDFRYEFQLLDSKPLIGFTDSSHYIPKGTTPNLIDVNVLNLKAIHVEITHISDKNMMQFLQINNIGGTLEIERVGKNIFNKTFNLESEFDFNPNQLTTYNLNLLGVDLSKSGLYSFSFSYKPNDIYYPNDSLISIINVDTLSLIPTSFAFKHNIIFTDIHAIAKLTTDDSLFIFVSDFNTGMPIKERKIEIFDFQQNKTSTLFTNENGVAKTKLNPDDLFLRIESNSNVTYLKLDLISVLPQKNSAATGIKSNNGLLCYIEGLKEMYSQLDSMQIAVILKKNGIDDLIKKNLEIKLESPDHFFFNTQISSLNHSDIKLYAVLLPTNYKTGRWNLIVKSESSELHYPFQLVNKASLPLPTQFKLDQKKKTLEINSNGQETYLRNQNVIVTITQNVSSLKNMFPNFVFNTPKSDSTLNVSRYKIKFDKKGKSNIALPGWIKPGNQFRVDLKVDFPDGLSMGNDTILCIKNEYLWIGIDPQWETDTTLNINLISLDNFLKPCEKYSEFLIEIIPKLNSSTLSPISFFDTILTFAGTETLIVNAKKTMGKECTLKVTDINSKSMGITHLKNRDIDDFKEMGIVLNLDKKNYYTGDTCHIFYKSATTENALITLENSTEIFHSRWVESSNKTQKLSVLITENMIPGLYVTLLNYNTISSSTSHVYASVTNRANINNKELGIDIQHDWYTNKKVPIHISNTNNEELNYYISISSPIYSEMEPLPIEKYFNQKQQNTILSFSSTHFEKYNHKPIQHGTDISKTNSNPVFTNANTSSNLHVLLGIYNLKANSATSHFIEVPNCTGDIEIKIVGIYAKTGKIIEKKQLATIADPISILVQMPAYLYAEDIVHIPIEIISASQKPDTINIKVLNIKNLEPINEMESSTIIIKNKPTQLSLVFMAKKLNGYGEFQISVKSKTIKQTKNITIPILSNQNYLIQTKTAKIPPQKQWQQTITPLGIKGTNNAFIEFSTIEIPKIWHLLQIYEQSTTGNLSRLIDKTFPLIFLNKLIDDPILKSQNSLKINNALTQLSKYQSRNGGFMLIPENTDIDRHLTCYTGEFMLKAAENGFEINEGIFNKWIRFQKNEFNQIKYSFQPSELGYSYLFYTLSLANAIEIKQLNEFMFNKNNELLDKLYIANTYAILGRQRLARTFINFDSINQITPHLNIDETTLLLKLSNLMGNTALSAKLISQLNKLIDNERTNTQKIGMAFNSLLDALSSFNSNSMTQINYQINNGKENRIKSSSTLTYIEIPLEFTLSKHVDITNTSSDTLYLNISHKGSPQEPTSFNTETNNLQILNQYYNLDNTDLNTKNINNGIPYKQIISLKNTNAKENQNLSVSIPKSTGVELIYSNVQLSKGVNNVKNEPVELNIPLNPLEKYDIILIYKPVYKGVFTSYPITIGNNDAFYEKTYTPQAKIYIK